MAEPPTKRARPQESVEDRIFFRPQSAAEVVAYQLSAAPLTGNSKPPPPGKYFIKEPEVRKEDEAALENSRLGPATARHTYILTGSMGLDHTHLRNLMRERGWREVAITEGEADFVWAEMYGSRFDPRSYRARCSLKNLLRDERKRIVTDKASLHSEIARISPDVAERLMAPTRALKDVAEVAAGEILILRPAGVWARAGNGIVRICSTEELNEAKARLLPKVPDAIASRYLTDHVLWEGRKFHLRMYWLVCAPCAGRPFAHALWGRGKILTAARPFVADSYWDRAVHDTHVKGTPRNLFFPEDVGLEPPQCGALLAGMREALDAAAAVLRPHAVPFDESRFAYEVFGADFLITADMRPVLLELNERVGFACIGDDADGRYAEFARQYYEWVYDNAIGPMIEAIDAGDALMSPAL